MSFYPYSELVGNDLDKNKALNPEQLVSEAERIVYDNRANITQRRLSGIISRLNEFLSGRDFMMNSAQNKQDLIRRTKLVIAEATRKLNGDGRGKRRKTMRKQSKRRRGMRRTRGGR